MRFFYIPFWASTLIGASSLSGLLRSLSEPDDSTIYHIDVSSYQEGGIPTPLFAGEEPPALLPIEIRAGPTKSAFTESKITLSTKVVNGISCDVYRHPSTGAVLRTVKHPSTLMAGSPGYMMAESRLKSLLCDPSRITIDRRTISFSSSGGRNRITLRQPTVAVRVSPITIAGNYTVDLDSLRLGNGVNISRLINGSLPSEALTIPVTLNPSGISLFPGGAIPAIIAAAPPSIASAFFQEKSDALDILFKVANALQCSLTFGEEGTGVIASATPVVGTRMMGTRGQMAAEAALASLLCSPERIIVLDYGLVQFANQQGTVTLRPARII